MEQLEPTVLCFKFCKLFVVNFVFITIVDMVMVIVNFSLIVGHKNMFEKRILSFPRKMSFL